MASLSCLECGAPRDPLDAVCRHCPAVETSEPELASRWLGVFRRARSLIGLTFAVEGQLARSTALPIRWKHVGWAVAAAFSVLAGEILALRAPPEDRFAAWALLTGAMLGPLVVMLEYVSPPAGRHPSRDRCTCDRTTLCLGCRIFYDVDPPELPDIASPRSLPDGTLGACGRCGGEAHMSAGLARCRHCRAPLLPELAVLDRAARLQAQHMHDLQLASWFAVCRRHERARALATWVMRAKWLFMVAASSWVLIALLKGI